MVSNNLLIATIDPSQVLKKNKPNDVEENTRFEKELTVGGAVLSDTSCGVLNQDGSSFIMTIDHLGAILKYSNAIGEIRGFRFQDHLNKTILEVSEEGEVIFNTNGNVGLIVKSPDNKTYNSIRGNYGEEEGWFLGKATDNTKDVHLYNAKGEAYLSLIDTGDIRLVPLLGKATYSDGNFIVKGNLSIAGSSELVTPESDSVITSLVKNDTRGLIYQITSPSDPDFGILLQDGSSDKRLIVNANQSSKTSSVESAVSSKNIDITPFTTKVIDSLNKVTVVSYRDKNLNQVALGFDSSELKKELPLTVHTVKSGQADTFVSEEHIDLCSLSSYLLSGIKELSSHIVGLESKDDELRALLISLTSRIVALENRTSTSLFDLQKRILHLENTRNPQ